MAAGLIEKRRTRNRRREETRKYDHVPETKNLLKLGPLWRGEYDNRKSVGNIILVT